MAGRHTLVASVLSAIPIYIMQPISIPAGACGRIDKLIRDFLWGSTNGKKRIHLLNWEIVTQSKKQGSLGIKSTWKMNIAFMAKLRWRLLLEESLWAKVILNKYTKGKVDLIRFSKRQYSLNAWRGICSTADLLKSGVRIEV